MLAKCGLGDGWTAGTIISGASQTVRSPSSDGSGMRALATGRRLPTEDERTPRLDFDVRPSPSRFCSGRIEAAAASMEARGVTAKTVAEESRAEDGPLRCGVVSLLGRPLRRSGSSLDGTS